MRISLCTISFRHHLLSIGEIARFARGSGFDGIELWGVHARNLSGGYHAEWLAAHGLRVPMLSDYLPLDAPRDSLTERMADFCRLARNWRAPRLRTFAGTKGSAVTSPEERAHVVSGLRMAAGYLANHGLRLLVETHPGTLADNTASLLRLLEEVDHPALKVNFDALHVWEGGDDLLAAHDRLADHIDYYHLKNVRDRSDLAVFEPANVYAASGRRDGMTSLLEGTLDYGPFLESLRPNAEASLEWFGDACFSILPADLSKVRNIAAKRHDDMAFRIGVAG
ncbi:sugar phosphate isomerase/epimerase family protein [Phreatobacter stygius]|uniref:Sugar phosphate isomerase/epimerase n=1 Tax=Phreatobacter stygius TaxID=1940610 RepID=A0A4D7B6R6_9HYPH|nr:sugar phosphate isomerase/epimerase [Phreatobacter stygius]QCI66068.1 sugar phosphate isomerase/epimerase [Phreatobacter stygius]